jgi:hypothetical protein
LTIQFKKYGYFTALIGSILSGLFVYIVLTYLLIAPKITIPTSIAIFGLIFGLTIYYSSIPAHSNRKAQLDIALKDEQEYDIHAQDQHSRNENLSNILFVAIFGILIIISSISYTQDFHIFTNWENIDAIGIVQLGAAIMLCFFIPGYGIVLIITKKYKMDPIFVVILSYLFSMLLTGLTAYISVLYFDSSILESKYLFIVVYLSILVSFLVCYPTHRMDIPVDTNGKYNFYNRFMSNIIVTLWKYLRTRASELVVFGSLILLFVTSTYLLYGGLTIGDQWFHQGRALLFVSGSFREAALSYADTFYPPFQSGLLAALTTLSGIPLVNSYASIAFLNVTPMFAFYYFFLTWVPRNMKRAGLLACSLFILSSGFGWIYLLSTLSNQPVITEHSNLETLRSIGILDILRLSNFGIPTSPDFSTGLIYIALPAGFVLLGMLRTTFHGKIINIFIVTAISILGIISHFEFYLFIIIASLLPIIFKMKKRNYVYVAFLGAISLVYLMDVTSPGSFFTSLKILGFPLLLLTGLFIMVTWAIYLAVGRICKILESISISLKLLKKLPYLNIKFNSITMTVIVFLVAYGYLLSFIVLSQLSLDTIRDQSAYSTIPWYLYPMRLGITGLLGLAFILSYLFQKFEKQVFVFGVMIAVALFTGPYYSENRFSKYIMVAMVGFASLMFYKLLLWNFEIKPIRNVVLIGIIIVCSGLSTLIFIGYGSLILQTQDYINTLSRRHFPSISEVHLFESLYDRVDLDSKKYNVISFPREYERRDDGVMAKVSAFAGLPEDKLLQSPLTLNASSLDALYSHLYYSDARYILLPKADIDVAAGITKPTRFAIDHFKPIYENNDYILLEVPYIVRPTSSNPDVALVHNDGDYLLSREASHTQVLLYDNETFNLGRNGISESIQKNNQTQKIILAGLKADNGATLWSRTIKSEQHVNYIEAIFQITLQDENKSNDIRLRWSEGDKEYYIKLSKNGLELFEKSLDKRYFILSRNTEIQMNDGIEYTLKIESLDNSINIYLDNLLKIQASKGFVGNSDGISRIGLTSNHNIVEFRPIKIASISHPDRNIYDQSEYYNYYYPLSILALSRATYDIFSHNDLSVFSKNVILVPDALNVDNYTFNNYLNYVRGGGKLIVINSDNSFNGTFSKLFQMLPYESKRESFTSVTANKNQNVLTNITGLVKRSEMKQLPDVNVVASYRNNNNQTVAPFAIEKKYPNNGSLLLINAEGYFNTILNSPRQYFNSLANITEILALDSTKASISENTSIPMKGFKGNMGILGKIRVNSSSMSFVNDGSYPYLLNVTRLTITNKTNNSPMTLDNVLIKSLKIIGDSEVIINHTGKLNLPGATSDHNYISMLIPSKFDMTVHIEPQRLGHMEIVSQNHSVINSIKISNGSKIDFHNIEAVSPIKFVQVMLKNPEITVNGRTTIEHAYFNGYLESGGGLLNGDALDFQGVLKTKLDFVDHYNKPYRGGISTEYITYLQSVGMNGTLEQDKELLRLPLDVNIKAITEGHDIPWTNILVSTHNFVAIIVLSLAAVIGVLFGRRYIHRYYQR